MLETLWEFITHNRLTVFIWWLLFVIVFGIVLDRFIGLVQKVVIFLYRRISDTPQWHITIVQTLVWAARVSLWIVIIVIMASKLGIPPALIAALGTVLGAALGFGAQDIVKDVIKGAVHLLEKQFSVGDFVSFSISGTEYAGTIEDVNLRTVVINTENEGRLSVPQGSVVVVKNYSRIGSFIMDLPCEVDINVENALSILESLSWEIISRDFSHKLSDISQEDKDVLYTITDMVIRGVSSVSNGTLNIQIKGETIPGEQFSARRVLTKLCAAEFSQSGINIKNTVVVGGAA